MLNKGSISSISLSSSDVLSEAIDLLTMLEQLGDGLSRSNLNSQEIAWGGFLHTLSRIKQQLEVVEEQLEEEDAAFPDQLLSNAGLPPYQSQPMSSIAGRIQRAPTQAARDTSKDNGRVRELIESS